jgi:hypothetical protein
MKVEAYVKGGFSVATLAKADETDLGRMIIHATAVEQARIRRQYQRTPKVNCEDVTEDIRYKLGQDAAIGFVVGLFEAAKKSSGGQANEAITDFPDDV